ncbi:hypothetical protein Pfo_006876 [Paulownia fortunei]|nr:hypothetical protein Pfo_006876 [Paulownia fortunei]
MEIKRDRRNKSLFLTQGSYIGKVLQRFAMYEAKSVSTPLGKHFKLSATQAPGSDEEKNYMSRVPYASGVGNVMYEMVCSRPDLAYAISMVSRFMANPRDAHWEALKWTTRYLKGSMNLCLLFKKQEGGLEYVEGFVDFDYAKNLDTRKSLTGFIFIIFGTTMCWKSSLQYVVALSITKAEYIAIS